MQKQQELKDAVSLLNKYEKENNISTKEVRDNMNSHIEKLGKDAFELSEELIQLDKDNERIVREYYDRLAEENRKRTEEDFDLIRAQQIRKNKAANNLGCSSGGNSLSC